MKTPTVIGRHLSSSVRKPAEEIASGRFDAQENPLTNAYNLSVQNYHRHFTLSGHLFAAAAFICKQEKKTNSNRCHPRQCDILVRLARATRVGRRTCGRSVMDSLA